MNLAMEATTTTGVRLISMGYKYNYSKVLCYVATRNAGSTIFGDPYREWFQDNHDKLIS
jgi:hypothetical protein